MNNDSSKWAIEGLVNGAWGREHVGAADDSTLFDSRDEALAALPELAEALRCAADELRVVEA
jgi:hypothetical protein